MTSIILALILFLTAKTQTVSQLCQSSTVMLPSGTYSNIDTEGDFNGDGIADLLMVGNPTYVIYGTVGPFSDVVASAMTSSQGFKITSPYLIYSGANAGDVNGDGIDDIVLGVPSAPPVNTGKVYIIYGQSAGLPDIILSTMTTSQGLTITGYGPDDNAGARVSKAGDINDDGYSDVLVGGPVGHHYLIYGKNGHNDFSLSSLSTAQGTKIQIGASKFGPAGDINGDGIDDFMLSFPDISGYKGLVYVIYGKAGGISSTLSPTYASADGFRVSGGGAGESLGIFFSQAGDFNGDGYDDIIIGATEERTAAGYGSVYVIYGKHGNLADITVSSMTASQGFRISGTSTTILHPFVVSGSGDLNGDSTTDLVIANTVSAYVIYGKPRTYLDLTISNLTPAEGFRISGTSNQAASSRPISQNGGSALVIKITSNTFSVISKTSSWSCTPCLDGLSCATCPSDYSCAIECSGTTPNKYLNYCYSACPPSASFTYNKACYTSCPSSVPYYTGTSKSCSAACASNLFVSGYECVSSCPVATPYSYNKVCKVACPAEAPNVNSYTCYSTCPSSNPYLYGNECLSSCPAAAPYSYNNVCQAACPAQAPNSYNGICYSTCPSSASYLHNNQCYATCPASVPVAFNKVCQAACPTAAPNLYMSNCYSTCPSPAIYQYNKNCYTACPAAAPNLYNTDCYSTCPATAPHLYNQLCYVTCPATAPLNYNKQCIIACPASARIMEGTTCYSSCPSSAPYLYWNYCYATCPNTAPIVYNNLCYASCPAAAPNLYGNTCYSTCPAAAPLKYDNTCYSTCPAQAPQQYQGSCYPYIPGSSSLPIEECPPSAPYLYWNYCYATCPNTAPIVYNNLCYASCPAAAPNIYGNTCYSTCPPEAPLKYDNTCYSTCPDSAPQQYKGSCFPYIPESTSSPIKEQNTTTAEAAHQAENVASGGLVAASVLSSGNPSALLVASLNKMLDYIKYMQISHSGSLEKLFNDSSAEPSGGFLNLAPNLSEDFMNSSRYSFTPPPFRKYQVLSPFLRNYWEILMSTLIIAIIVVIFWTADLLLPRVSKKPIVQKITRKLKVTGQNLLLMQFYDSLADITLFSSLNLRSMSIQEWQDRLNLSILCICIAVGIAALTGHYLFIRRYQAIKSGSSLSKNTELNELVSRTRAIQVIYEELKDTSFICQGFLLFFNIRAVIFSLVIGLLFEHPLAQTIILVCLSLTMLAFVVKVKPFRSFLDLLQLISMEVVGLIVNLSLLILTINELKGTNPGLVETLDGVIIWSSIIINILALLFLIPKLVIEGINIFKYLYKLYKKHMEAKPDNVPMIKKTHHLDNTHEAQQLDNTHELHHLDNTHTREVLDLSQDGSVQVSIDHNMATTEKTAECTTQIKLNDSVSEIHSLSISESPSKQLRRGRINGIISIWPGRNRNLNE